jgi:arabinan endo-1,5-alpha-L-arabinosidase
MKFLRKYICLLPIIFALAAVDPSLAQTNQTPSWIARMPTDLTFEVSPAMAKFGSRGIYVHDPSPIVKCGSNYWVYYTGVGIASWHSSNLIKWERGPSAISNAPAWAAQAVPRNRWRNYWAPDVIHVGNRYLLYYAISSFGRNHSAIGLATNSTLNPDDPGFKWIDQGAVVQSMEGDNFNAIDPAAVLDTQGRLWLVFGSFWSGIKLVQLDANTGKRIDTNSLMYSLAFNDSIEASYIYPHDGNYYLFVNWGKCCRGTNSTYEIRVGRSPRVTGPYFDKDGEDMLVGGGSSFLASRGPFIGPGQSGIYSENGADWFSCHFYDGTRNGKAALAILPLAWDKNGWPQIDWDNLK